MFVYVTQISINLSPSCTHTQQVLLIGALVLAGWQLVETTFIPKSAAWAHAATMNDHRITEQINALVVFMLLPFFCVICFYLSLRRALAHQTSSSYRNSASC